MRKKSREIKLVKVQEYKAAKIIVEVDDELFEAMAQAAAILSFVTVGGEIDENSIVYFVGIDNARFKRPVTPGDALQLKVSLTRRIRGIWKFQAAAYVDDFLVAEAELMCTARDIPA